MRKPDSPVTEIDDYLKELDYKQRLWIEEARNPKSLMELKDVAFLKEQIVAVQKLRVLVNATLNDIDASIERHLDEIQ